MKVINLLPKSRQQEMRYTSLLSSVWVLVILSLFSFALVFLAQFFTKIYLDNKAISIKNQIEQVKIQVSKSENSDIKKKIQDANDIISDYNNLSNVPNWSNVLKAFALLPPQGITVNSFNVNSTDKTITVSGRSPTRELVIKFYNNILQDSKDFYNVDYPLENIAAPVDIGYHFTFYVRDSLLK